MTGPDYPPEFLDWSLQGPELREGFMSERLTKREYFAVLAMQALLSNSSQATVLADIAAERNITSDVLVAMLAVGQADALIAELSKDS